MKCSRIIALMLSLCLILGAMPLAAGAETASLGGDVTENEYVYLGGQKWIVLDTQDVTLLAADIVQKVAYNETGVDNSWASSDAKVWCESFYATSLEAGEKSAVSEIDFLSKAEAEALNKDVLKASAGWWLSTPYADDARFAYAVSDAGFVGYPHVAKNYGARPAANVDETKIVMTTAAVGGKNSQMDVVAENTSGEWKLTLQSDAYAAFTVSAVSVADRVVTVSFAGAAIGTNEQVSAIIKNTNGDILAYGPISKGVAEGTVTFDIPQSISGNLTVGVFNEQVNGDQKTDYAGAVSEYTVAVEYSYGGVKTWNLNLGDSVSANFVMDINTTDPEAVVEITANGSTNAIPVATVIANGNLVSVDLAAAQMTDAITLQVKDSSGAGILQSYTIRDYADYILANSNDEDAKNLVKAMLNYGGAAQSYFEYNTDHMANKGIALDNEQIPGTNTRPVSVEGSVAGIKFYGASVVATSKTQVRFYFTVSDENASYTVKYGETEYKLQEKEGLYYISVENINPDQLDEYITISVNDTLTVSYSPLTYIERMYHKTGSSDALRNFVKALYNYHIAAAAYTAE